MATDLTYRIIGAAMAVHRALGPGMLESTYERCMAAELADRGLSFRRQQPIPLVYKGARLDAGYRADLVVEGEVLVEVKAVARLDRVHVAQLLSYLRLSGHAVGLLINFNVTYLPEGIRRVLLGTPPGSVCSVYSVVKGLG